MQYQMYSSSTVPPIYMSKNEFPIKHLPHKRNQDSTGGAIFSPVLAACRKATK